MKRFGYGISAFAAMIFAGCANVSTPDRMSSSTSVSLSSTKEMLSPYNQILDPAGILISYGTSDKEQHALDCALSPDGKILAVEGRFNLVLIDAKTNRVIKTINLGKDLGVYSGIIWSKDGNDIYMTTSENKKGKIGKILDIKIDDGNVIISTLAEFLPQNGKRVLPNDMKLSKDGKYMFLTLNGANNVVKFDIENKKIVWEKNVDKFPYGLAIANNKLYISEWGGRIPNANDTTSKAGWNSIEKNEDIVANPKNGGAASGVVTVMDMNGNIIKNIVVGLHPNDIISDKNENKVYVANANSDTVSVIDANNDEVIKTISISPNKLPFGCSPDALVLSHDGKDLYVGDAMINAVAVVDLEDGKVDGFIPTGAYPGGLDISKDDKTLYVADTEGLLSTVTTHDTNDKAFRFLHGHENIYGQNGSTAGAYNTHRELGYISVINLPDDDDDLEDYTKKVLSNIKYKTILATLRKLSLPVRKDVKPKPIPERLGEPSVFKHVIYIIKENRSYDQVLGDMKEGNGYSYLTIFGQKVTPNEHKLAKNFLLLDNYYTPSKCSAEGHPWADAAFTDDYVEKNVRAWFRGYYHNILDNMVTPKTGYIWDNVLNHGLSFKDYGEGLKPYFDKSITWSDVYQDYLNGNKFEFENKGAIKHLVQYQDKNYPGYDSHKIPDQLRAEAFIKDLKKYEKSGKMPNFIIMALPDDHTAGLKPGYPTPSAMVADNDLALGKIVDALSHSKFWKNTVIFVTEDDSQDGWDHVSAYRTVGFVISAYSRLHKPVHTYYNSLSMVHTMEQILGIPPMNIFDASAPLMYDCFSNEANLTPYKYVKNEIPLNQMNPFPTALKGKALYWSKIATTLSNEIDDPDNDEPLNKMLWYSVKGYDTPYPVGYTMPDAKDGDD